MISIDGYYPIWYLILATSSVFVSDSIKRCSVCEKERLGIFPKPTLMQLFTLITLQILRIFAQQGPSVQTGQSISDTASLQGFDLDSLVARRTRIVDALKQKIKILIKSPPENQNFNLNAAVELLESRIDQINNLERVLLKALLIFDKIVKSQKIEELDKLMESESNIIITEFQNLVMEAKNHEATTKSTKKVEDKARVAGQFEPNPANSTSNSTIIENVLKDVATTADNLEDKLNSDEFKKGQAKEGTSVETVIKVPTEHQEQKSENGTAAANSGTKEASVLIDSSNNQYVLSKPGDATAHIEGIMILIRFKATQ